MTERAKIFVKIIESVCWTKGWGTNGSTECFPEHNGGVELKWLVDNGYLFHFEKEVEQKHRNWRYRYRTQQRFGVTRKGWSVAGKYIDAAGIELQYQQPYYPQRPQ